jgi:hypothetical protein
MNTFQFGCGNGQIAARKASQINKIAKEHGATFIATKLPEGHRYWFTAENRGEPFDSSLATSVKARVQNAGLLSF